MTGTSLVTHPTTVLLINSLRNVVLAVRLRSVSITGDAYAIVSM